MFRILATYLISLCFSFIFHLISLCFSFISHAHTDVSKLQPAVQVLDDLLAKVTDPAERAKLLKLKRDHSDKIEAAIRGIADIERRASMDANEEE